MSGAPQPSPQARPAAADATAAQPRGRSAADGGYLRLLRSLPRDKADTLLLLLAALLVLAPHAEHLPLWISLMVGATFAWRAALTLRGRRLPPLWLLLPVSLAAMAGVYYSYHTLLGRDAGVAMLALLLAFKLLEMHARRDLYVVIFLSYFVLLTNFFYSQTLLTGVLMVATLLLLLTAQLSFQFSAAVPSLALRLRIAAKIFAIGVPLSLLMFFGFPRIQGPLWGLPGDAHSARSGMSDSMAPGNVSALAMSNEVAFRARFLDKVPAQPQLYWRGIVLGDYDGRTWRRMVYQYREDLQIAVKGKPVRYRLTMEPTRQRWLFLLELGGPDLSVPGHSIGASDELEFFTHAPINERLRFQADAYLSFDVQARDRPDQLNKWLQLPYGFNPRTLALAAQLRRKDPAASAQAVLTMFRQQPFRYTLDPPLLGRDAVDDFLFGTRAGFCEHYTSAFVVLMRAMHIPARVITGYQGGEMNPVDDYMTVRQSDAHAWAEIWLPGQGWRRIDPTAAVAPDRVALNLARALPESSGFSLVNLMDFEKSQPAWLAQLGFRWNAMNNAWNQWVLDYNPEKQRSFLEELADSFGNLRSLLGLALCAALLLLLRRQHGRSPPDPLDALYLAFCRQQARHGVLRAADEGPASFAARLRAAPASPARAQALEEFIRLYSALKYGRASPDPSRASLRALRKLLPLCR
ncbi:DUF3488 domain-containing transglutaminase family protein [Oxalobacteraceae bacterium]|nr:DUF3488 domain-containing transglutaminase family protein [Oxalobacteraceae bacterium]